MASLESTFACLPATQRGKGILIGGDAKSLKICYASGKNIIIRGLKDSLDCIVYTGHAYATTVARFHPNGEWIASGDVSGQVRIWAVKGEEHTLRFEIKALSGSIDDLAWSQDGERIVVSGDGKGATLVKAFLWDSGANVGEFDGHSKRVLSCTFKPTRPYRIATCGEDMLANFYEGPPFKFKTSFREHSNFVNCVRYSPDGKKFITVGSDKKGIIYSGQTGEKTGEFTGHTGSIYALSWSSGSKQILTVSADKTAKIWDISEDGSSGTLAQTFTFADKPEVEHMQVGCLWLGEYIITVSLSGEINFLQTGTERPIHTLSGHQKNVTALAVLPGQVPELYSASYDGAILRWQLGKGCLGRLKGKGHGTSICALAIPSSAPELLSCGLDDAVRRTALPADTCYSEPVALGAQPSDLDATPDGSLAVAATAQGIVLLKGTKVLSKTGVKFQASAAAIAPDGQEVAVGSADGKIKIYRVKGDTLEEEAVLEKHRGGITCIRYSPNGAWLASGDQNREATVWDRATREVKTKAMVYHTARISCLSWSPDSQRVATGSLDTNVLVYEIDKPAADRLTIKGAHSGGITAVAWVDDAKLASAGDDACIRVWSVPR